ncbi:hypothetical protein DPQ33_05790 [Oceanidesulfovibrio indonesiensis]|uniref:Uncharacterized protein n=1 Tax=Oceanidesulfovibrio indonesiensis TaxID=54767 RepID=A0A7M3MG19_9BACT|nr:hypothetical protein [Oceanidesulfovibrio indonesiensis]TVM18266.1 hypothetical protein DPQ33_05790 [Oceanidesulfovibrio indonesiensis]
MYRILDWATYVFDPLHALWEKPRTQRGIALAQISLFLLGLAGIELNRRGLLPEPVATLTPTSHYYAIKLAFGLVLLKEVIDLVFTLPCSMSRAVGKQFEILALILLRNAFKELVHFQEPIEIADGIGPVLPIIADAAGALFIFVGLGIYSRLHVKRKSSKSAGALYRFVATKKLLALVLLGIFFSVGVDMGLTAMQTGHSQPFFDVFYTVLIFSDILLVLISSLYLPSFHSTFRNSGFAVSTLLIRMALASPRYWDALLGVTAVTFAICLTLAYNYLAPDGPAGREE